VVWTKLVDWTGGALWHGAGLPLPAHYPLNASSTSLSLIQRIATEVSDSWSTAVTRRD
jgi:hypothetical protein